MLSASSVVPISADFQHIEVWSADSREWKTLRNITGYAARYAPSGHLVYACAGGLRAVPFDLDRLEVTGKPEPVLTSLRTDSLWANAQYTFSHVGSGSLAYIAGGDMGVGVPAWFNRQGKVEPLNLPPHSYGVFMLSPDGKRLAIQVSGVRDDIYVHDVTTGRVEERSNLLPLATERAEDGSEGSR